MQLVLVRKHNYAVLATLAVFGHTVTDQFAPDAPALVSRHNGYEPGLSGLARTDCDARNRQRRLPEAASPFDEFPVLRMDYAAALSRIAARYQQRF